MQQWFSQRCQVAFRISIRNENQPIDRLWYLGDTTQAARTEIQELMMWYGKELGDQSPGGETTIKNPSLL